MGDLKKSKHLLAEMGIDVEELKEMSQSIMNASSSPMSSKASPQKGARSTRGGVGRTAQHGAARHVHVARDKSRTYYMLQPNLSAALTPTLPLTMAGSKLGRPDTAPGRLPKMPPTSPGMESPGVQPPRT
jgi:hypothetical protein